MKLIGGTLLADKTFKKILSIGYEFETHDLAKLSLHQNKKSLINSNLSVNQMNPTRNFNNTTNINNSNQLAGAVAAMPSISNQYSMHNQNTPSSVLVANPLVSNSLNSFLLYYYDDSNSTYS